MAHPDNTRRFVELNFNSDPANLAAARRAVEAFCEKAGFGEHASGQVGMCVNEALANVMRHAYDGATDRPIFLRVECQGDQLRVSIRDWGNGVNPQELPPRRRDPMRPGGIGLICLRQLMDEVVFERQADGMLLTMTRQRKNVGEEYPTYRKASSDRAVG
jgi:anti-sigma regulatory factor (Ser/Thr protein kinase)